MWLPSFNNNIAPVENRNALGKKSSLSSQPNRGDLDATILTSTTQ